MGKTLLKAFSIFVVFIFVGCSIINKSRDNKALARIYSRTDLSAQAYSVLEKQHPCINTVEYIKGKDSVIIDSSYNNENIAFLNDYIDSLKKKINENPYYTINIDSLKNVIEKKCKPQKIYILRTDSIRTEDTKNLNEVKAENNIKQGQIIQLNKQITELKLSNKNKIFWIIGLGCFILLAAFLRIKRVI